MVRAMIWRASHGGVLTRRAGLAACASLQRVDKRSHHAYHQHRRKEGGGAAPLAAKTSGRRAMAAEEEGKEGRLSMAASPLQRQRHLLTR
jgi:hypothetical protein